MHRSSTPLRIWMVQFSKSSPAAGSMPDMISAPADKIRRCFLVLVGPVELDRLLPLSRTEDLNRASGRIVLQAAVRPAARLMVEILPQPRAARLLRVEG